jgi:hypothetical protein
MTDFDPIKAQREEVAGLADVHRVIATRAREAEQRLAEAEADHDSFVKLSAFVVGLLDEAKAKLRALQDDADRKEKSQ